MQASINKHNASNTLDLANDQALGVSLGPKAEQTKKLILAAAQIRFSQFGLQGTRVRDIADAAGVNVATLYNYYKNKQALYEAVLNDGLCPIVEIMGLYTSYEFNEQTIHTIVEQVLGHLQKNPAISKLIYMESINNGVYLQQLCERWFKPLSQEAVKYFGDEFSDVEKQQLIGLFFHLSFGHFSLSPLLDQVFDGETSSEAGVKQHAAFTIDLLKKLFPKIN